MPEHFSKSNQLDSHSLESELEPISSFLDQWSDPEAEEEEFRSDFFQGLSGRRKKAAFTLTVIWGVTIGLHLVPRGIWIMAGIGVLVAIQGLRLLFASPANEAILANEEIREFPKVSLLVAAKNEEAVIAKLVQRLCQLDYPLDKYEVWLINDNSSDNTGKIVDQLAQQYENLNVLHRDKSATGGKSGALNQVLPLTKGDIVGVFDADAIASPDLLNHVVAKFKNPQIGAVQVRKEIDNSGENFWTKGQSAEMALDAYFQEQRIACGGVGELRGNGQFVRREALTSCGGWNEETITDDLDLTIRLHLDQWDIDVLNDPSVGEEGVSNVVSLWHQRNRWGEGGYQRYFDYWRLILGKRLNWQKKFDLLYFFFVQYILPTAAIPDLLMVITRHHLPLIAPLTSLTLILACWGMFTGLRRTKLNETLTFTDLYLIFGQTLRGMIYLVHWFIIIPSMTARISIRPKRLKWVKTVHQGVSQ
jgi:1,2-diacylglycerol 3-beta-glucosyltransferase